MLIYCPKCSSAYEIDEDLIKDNSRKVKCSRCNEIFEAGSLIKKSVDNIVYDNELEDISEENAFEALAALMRDADVLDTSEIFADRISENDKSEPDILTGEDVASSDDVSYENVQNNVQENNSDVENTDDSDANVTDEAEQPEPKEEEDNVIDIESIYERLSEHTSHLIERENRLPLYEKIWLKIKEILGFHFKIKWKYVVVAVGIFVSLSLFNNRYEVVRKLPFMNGIYKVFGINAKIAGEGLEFQNITWDYVIDAGVKKMEIKGFINNITEDTLDLPIVHVEILDKDSSLLQSFNREFKDGKISSTGRVPLQVVVENPAPTAKYIYLTFIDKE